MLVEIATTESFNEIRSAVCDRRAAGKRLHRQGADRRPAGRARTSSTASGSRTWPSPTIIGEAAGRPLPHRAERPARGLLRLVGRHRRARAGASTRRAAACAPTPPCATTGRTSSSIPATASMPIARSSSTLKLPNGEVWRNIVTEEKSHVAQTLADYRGNYKYNLLDAQSARASTPRCRCSRNGTTTRSPTTGGRARPAPTMATPTPRCWRRAAAARSANTCRCGRRWPTPAASIARSRYGPLLDIFLLDMRSYRGPNDHGKRRDVRPGLPDPRARRRSQWLKRELMRLERDLEGDRRRPADRRSSARTRSRRATARRSAASSRSPTCCPSSSTPASATRCGSPPTCITPRRTTTIRTARCSRTSSRSGSSCPARSTPAPGAPGAARQHVRAGGDVPERLQRRAGREPGALLRLAVLRPCRHRRRRPR